MIHLRGGPFCLVTGSIGGFRSFPITASCSLLTTTVDVPRGRGGKFIQLAGLWQSLVGLLAGGAFIDASSTKVHMVPKRMDVWFPNRADGTIC